jgi:hypothetical protein
MKWEKTDPYNSTDNSKNSRALVYCKDDTSDPWIIMSYLKR